MKHGPARPAGLGGRRGGDRAGRVKAHDPLNQQLRFTPAGAEMLT